MQLQAFLRQRIIEIQSEDVFLTTVAFKSAPEVVNANHSEPKLKKQLDAVDEVLRAIQDPHLLRLCEIKHTAKYATTQN